MMEEIWKPIPNYEGLYEVSDLGRVKSLNYNRTKTEKFLKLQKNSVGYYHVILKGKTLQVHQLVAITFLNHIPNGYNLIIDHINDNKLDNRPKNLQIVTARFNTCKTQGNYSSKYKGVSWSKAAKKLLSFIRINGKLKHLGLFNCELSASIAYQNKLKEIS